LIGKFSLESVKAVITELSPLTEEGDGQFRGRCPFPSHIDKRPSFLITANDDYKGIWVCSCGSGTLTNFVENILECDRNEAIQYLLDYESKEPDIYENIDSILNTMDVSESVLNIKLPINEMKRKLITHYLILKRRYTPYEADIIIDRYKLTVCVDPYLPYCYDWIIVPIFDIKNNLVMWLGQDPNSRDKYNRGNSSGILFGLHSLNWRGDSDGKSWVIVVESVWCAIKLNMWGYNALATMGARLDQRQSQLISALFNNVCLCYDNDVAGKKAQNKAIESLTPQCKVDIIDMPIGKDPDKCTKEEFESFLNKKYRVDYVSV
jgi:hypothetical protein